MKIALVGATGLVGTKLLAELVARGHEVTAIARNIPKSQLHESVSTKQCDVLNFSALASALEGADCVAVSLSAKGAENVRESYLAAIRSVMHAVRLAGGMRTIFVGGAGSLQVETGVDFVDTDDFPPVAKLGSLAVRDALNLLRSTPDFDWTMLSPSMFVAGTRTGQFRIGSDALLRNEQGKPAISLEDYAMAFVDEIERPARVGKRFTVGY